MTIAELINYKMFIEDIVKCQKYQIDLSHYRSTEPVKEKLKRSYVRKVSKETINKIAEPEDNSKQMKNMTEEALATQIRLELKMLFKDNLIVSGTQMTMRPQVAEILNKYFSGYQTSLSIELLANALDLHYEGLSAQSKGFFVQGLSHLASRCG